MSELRVLQFVNVLDRGGTESFIFNNLERMNRENVNFDFLLTRNQVEAYDDKVKELNGHKIVILPSSGNAIKRYFSLYKNLYHFFRESDYRIVHFESNPPGVMSTASVIAAKRAGIPIRILHSHGSGGEKLSYAFLRPIITRICRLIITSCCTDYMAPSKLAAEYAFGKRIAGSAQCTYIFNGVDTNKFLFSEKLRRQVRDEYGISRCLVFGTVARFSEVKNHLLMVKILREIKNKFSGVKLLLVGGEIDSEPGIKKRVIDLAKELDVFDDIIFVGQTNDVNKYLCAMDAFIMTSRSEGLPFSGIEAQINGLSVVATADKIPQELDITGRVRWVPLDAPSQIWGENIVMASSMRRQLEIIDSELERYDVRNTALFLEKYYLRKERGLQDE